MRYSADLFLVSALDELIVRVIVVLLHDDSQIVPVELLCQKNSEKALCVDAAVLLLNPDRALVGVGLSDEK